MLEYARKEPAVVRGKSKVSIMRKNRNGIQFFLFVFPAVAVILLMSEIPFLMSIFYSFTKWNGITRAPEFIGFGNFVEIFTEDTKAKEAILFTLKQTFIITVIMNVLA